MSWLSRFARSTVGMKILMGLTGLVLYGFVFVHMLGNLQVFEGAEKIDAYGEMLHQVTEVLWGARLTLLGALAVHVWAAVNLSRRSMQARPQAYKVKKHLAANLASLTMRATGPIILIFLIFHLGHLTTGHFHPSFVFGKVFDNVTTAFRNPLVAGFYVVSMLALAPHLAHGGYSMFRSFGVESDNWSSLARLGSRAFAAVIVLGNIAIPVAILAGLVK